MACGWIVVREVGVRRFRRLPAKREEPCGLPTGENKFCEVHMREQALLETMIARRQAQMFLDRLHKPKEK